MFFTKLNYAYSGLLIDKIYKNTIRRFTRKLEDDESETIDGSHGVFIDLIDIDPAFQLPVDIALKNNIFVFIVDTGMLFLNQFLASQAQKWININKSINGGLIKVFPLEFIDEIDDTVPELQESDEMYPLIYRVRIKDNVDEKVENF